MLNYYLSCNLRRGMTKEEVVVEVEPSMIVVVVVSGRSSIDVVELEVLVGRVEDVVVEDDVVVSVPVSGCI